MACTLINAHCKCFGEIHHLVSLDNVVQTNSLDLPVDYTSVSPLYVDYEVE